MLLVTGNVDGSNRRQLVLQARADAFAMKVSGKRDGGVGLGSWMYSKMHPTPIPVPVYIPFATAPPVLPAVIQRIATSVSANYFTQPGGKTRQEVIDALGSFEMDLETLGRKSKRGRYVPEGRANDADEEETSEEMGPSDNTPARVESVGGGELGESCCRYANRVASGQAQPRTACERPMAHSGRTCACTGSAGPNQQPQIPTCWRLSGVAAVKTIFPRFFFLQFFSS